MVALDIRPLLGQSDMLAQTGAMLLIVQAHGIEVGLLADHVIEVRHAYRDLSPSFSAAEGQPVTWLRGIDQDLTVLLDLTLLLADPRLALNDAGNRGL